MERIDHKRMIDRVECDYATEPGRRWDCQIFGPMGVKRLGQEETQHVNSLNFHNPEKVVESQSDESGMITSYYDNGECMLAESDGELVLSCE